MKCASIKIDRIQTLLAVSTISCLLTIGKGYEAFETYVENDNLLPMEELKNVDQVDTEDSTSRSSDSTTTTFVTNALIVTRRQDKCNEDQIMLDLAEIQVINPETILQIASYKDLQSVCRLVRTGKFAYIKSAAGLRVTLFFFFKFLESSCCVS